MNKQKVQQLINQEIAELHARIGGKAARKQYAPAKWQIAKLTELGILDLMPVGFGHSDASAVIEAATTKGTAVFNAYGEGEEIPASELNQAMNEVETEKTFQKGQEIEVKPRIAYQHLSGGAVVNPMIARDVSGYKTTIQNIFKEIYEDEHGNEVVEIIIETATGELVKPSDIL